jgi:carnitine 3-dehydrogenase
MEANDIKRVACIGAGMIGASWAVNFAMRGYPVCLYDINQIQLEDAQKNIRANLGSLQENNILTKQEADYAENLIGYTTRMEDAVRNVQFIQESGPESYEIKQGIFSEVERYTSPQTIIASSTSGLLISKIAASLEHPGRCIGAHPYNPPHIIPLVEINKGDKTDPDIVRCAYDFYVLLGKEPIILQKETLGFIANRMQIALNREGIDLVCRGVCSVEDVDKAVVFGPGLRWAALGPNLIAQLGGGEKGIKGLSMHLNPSAEKWLKDMAKWDEFPEGWPDIAQDGVNKEMVNRKAEFGRTNAELAKFRDRVLLELLKLHKKL